MKGYTNTNYRNVRLDVCVNNPFGGKTFLNTSKAIPKLHTYLLHGAESFLRS